MGNKKRSPKEIIESGDNPSTEHVYFKFPGKELVDITLYGDDSSVISDDEKLFSLLKEKNNEESYTPVYSDVHTHPAQENGSKLLAFPSKGDLTHFFVNKKGVRARTMIIAQQDGKTGEVGGYFLLKKKKSFKYKDGLINDFFPLITSSYKATRMAPPANPKEYTRSMKEGFKNLAEKYDLQCRWVPARGYELENYMFVKKKGLERKILVVSVALGLIGLLILISSNITGNVVSNLNQTSSNWIGGVLFIIGLIGIFTYLRRK